jgi:hypothetical protein
MKERLDNRVLGAVRWLDAVTERPIAQPLAVASSDLRFVRNRSGLSVIVSAAGLGAYEACLDLNSLSPADVVPDLSLDLTAAVSDPTGRYLPRRFSLKLPRTAQPPRLPNGRRPADSLFEPVSISLLPSPLAEVATGWAQVRVTARTAAGGPLKNLFLRVVATAGNAILGRGMTDARGEGLVIVPGLKLFAPGNTPEEVTTRETEVRLEAIPPTGDDDPVDWTELDPLAAAPENVTTLKLKAGKTYARDFPLVDE